MGAWCFQLSWSHLDSQNRLTLQAKLVSCQFIARQVMRGYFNCQTCSHVHCAHGYFVHRAVHLAHTLPDLGIQLIVVITWSHPPSPGLALWLSFEHFTTWGWSSLFSCPYSSVLQLLWPTSWRHWSQVCCFHNLCVAVLGKTSLSS